MFYSQPSQKRRRHIAYKVIIINAKKQDILHFFRRKRAVIEKKHNTLRLETQHVAVAITARCVGDHSTLRFSALL